MPVLPREIVLPSLRDRGPWILRINERIHFLHILQVAGNEIALIFLPDCVLNGTDFVFYCLLVRRNIMLSRYFNAFLENKKQSLALGLLQLRQNPAL